MRSVMDLSQQHQGSIATIRLAGHLSSEAASMVEDAFQQAAGAEKVLLAFI